MYHNVIKKIICVFLVMMIIMFNGYFSEFNRVYADNTVYNVSA